MDSTSHRDASITEIGERRRRALVVEDDPLVADVLLENLCDDRYAVSVASTGAQAIRMAADTHPDVAIVDLGLPDVPGLDVVSALRAGDRDGRWNASLAIVMLTGRDDPQSVVRALDRGADDYVTKPFAYAELLARVQAALRRSLGESTRVSVRVGPLELDRRAFHAAVDGRALPLSSKEFTLLSVLARDPNRVVTKAELMREVWGFNHPTRTRTLDTHVSRLRAKLRARGLERWLGNVWGVGYRLLPEEA